jgi:hypothetical protein
MADDKKEPRYLSVISDSEEEVGILQEDPRLLVKDWHEYNSLTPADKQRVRESVNLRRRAAFVMNAQGKPVTEIARIMGVTAAVITDDVNRAARELTKNGLLDVEVARQRQLHVLDRLTETYFAPAVNGDIDAANLLLQVEGRKAKLTGADQPLKLKVNVTRREIGSGKMSQEEFDKRMFNLAMRMKSRGKLGDNSPGMKLWMENNKDRFQVVDGEIVEVNPSASKKPADSALLGQTPSNESENVTPATKMTPSGPESVKSTLSRAESSATQCFPEDETGNLGPNGPKRVH